MVAAEGHGFQGRRIGHSSEDIDWQRTGDGAFRLVPAPHSDDGALLLGKETYETHARQCLSPAKIEVAER